MLRSCSNHAISCSDRPCTINSVSCFLLRCVAVFLWVFLIPQFLHRLWWAFHAFCCQNCWSYVGCFAAQGCSPHCSGCFIHCAFHGCFAHCKEVACIVLVLVSVLLFLLLFLLLLLLLLWWWWWWWADGESARWWRQQILELTGTFPCEASARRARELLRYMWDAIHYVFELLFLGEPDKQNFPLAWPSLLESSLAELLEVVSWVGILPVQ